MTVSKISDDEKIRRMERSRTRFGFSPPKTELGAMSGDQTNDTTRPASNEKTQIRSRSTSRKKPGWRRTWVSLFDWRDPATIAMMAVLISWCLLPAAFFYWSVPKASLTPTKEIPSTQTVPAESDIALIKKLFETLIDANENQQQNIAKYENQQNVNFDNLKSKVDKLVEESAASAKLSKHFMAESQELLAEIDQKIHFSGENRYRPGGGTGNLNRPNVGNIGTNIGNNVSSPANNEPILSLPILKLMTKEQWNQVLLILKKLPKEKLEAFSTAAKTITDDATTDEEKKQILSCLGALLITPKNHYAMTPDLEKIWATVNPQDEMKDKNRQ